jgi:hypothetical protein
MNTKPKRRKQFLVSSVQRALVRRIILHWAIFFALVFFTLPMWRMMCSMDLLANSFPEMLRQSLAASMPVLVILLAMIPIFARDTVRFSNRFAGPMYRFQKTIQAVNSGETVPPIRLRRGDFWAGFADDLNLLLQEVTDHRQAQSAAEEAPTVCAIHAGQADAAEDSDQ